MVKINVTSILEIFASLDDFDDCLIAILLRFHLTKSILFISYKFD